MNTEGAHKREKMKITPCFKTYPEKPYTSGLESNFCPKCCTKLIAMKQKGVFRKVCAKCQYIQYINPLPGVAVLIENDHKLLIGRRSQKSFLGGKWCLPCGFIEHNESFVEAACREVFEETGLSINITSLINVSSNRLTPGLHTIVTVLMAEIGGGKLQAGDDMEKIMWVDNSVPLPELAFESDSFIIAKYFEKVLIKIPIEAE